MNKLLSNGYLLLISRAILAVVFIFAGMEKIADPAAFSDSINNYRVMPLFSINVFAIFIPWLEVISGILLLFGIKQRENSFILGGLLLVFIVLILSAIIRGLDIDCGCFGTIRAEMVGFRKIIENILLFLLGIHIYIFKGDKFSLYGN
jgi:putative oxidoreductase